MNEQTMSVTSNYSNLIRLDVTPGHFATSSSHINYYIDMTSLKTRHDMAKEAARALAQEYIINTEVNTIVCLDGTDIIGAYLADELTSGGLYTASINQNVAIVNPEQNTNGQLMFRENYQPMIKGKHVLVLLATATTGRTVRTALECIEYYGGSIAGVAAIFSAEEEISGQKICRLFSTENIPQYATYKVADCPHCLANKPVDAIVNSFGYSKF